MTGEFDDAHFLAPRADAAGRIAAAAAPTASLAARLVARLYASADHALKADLLACLVRPLGLLGLSAIAAGAFARLVAGGQAPGAAPAIGEVTRFTSRQVLELASFVEQVNPGALQQFARTLSESGITTTAFAAAAAAVLARVVNQARA